MKEQKIAPEDIFTGKDLDYLKDMFGWNHTAYKLCMNSLCDIEDKKVEKVISDCCEMFMDNMKLIIKIVGDGTNE